MTLLLTLVTLVDTVFIYFILHWGVVITQSYFISFVQGNIKRELIMLYIL